MLDLEENSKLLETIKEKIKDLGESLWHRKKYKTIKRFRKWNIERGFLERQ